jgi:hypothetical protein
MERFDGTVLPDLRHQNFGADVTSRARRPMVLSRALPNAALAWLSTSDNMS